MTIGERIRTLREGCELTQSALGSKLHMTQRKISYIESDKYEPSISDIKAICMFFNVSAGYLLGLPENMPYPKR